MEDSYFKIHQIWFNFNEPNCNSPPLQFIYMGSISSVLRLNISKFEYIFWNMSDANDYMNSIDNKQWKKFWFDKLSPNIKEHKRLVQCCDFFRFVLMYYETGIYLDLDFFCTRELSSIFDLITSDAAVVFEPKEHTSPKETRPRLCNGLLFSKRKHSNFWKDWINSIIYSFTPLKSVFGTTGPVAFSKYFYSLFPGQRSNVTVLNKCLFLGYSGYRKLSNECTNVIPLEIENYIRSKELDKVGNYMYLVNYWHLYPTGKLIYSPTRRDFLKLINDFKLETSNVRQTKTMTQKDLIDSTSFPSENLNTVIVIASLCGVLFIIVLIIIVVFYTQRKKNVTNGYS